MADPLLCDFPLPLHRRFYPLGLPLDLFSNSEPVLDAAERSWGSFSQAFDRAAVLLQIGVTEAEQSGSPGAPVTRARRNLICINADSDNFGVCDLRQSHGFAWVSANVGRDTPFLRYFFIEALGYVLLTAAHLAPVHAACIERDGRGILLCGDSGAGKSSLAYACARAGWGYACDDASFLLRGDDSLTVTGNPYLVRLRDSAPALFPEFKRFPVTSRPDGKPTLEIETRTLRDVRIRCRTKISHALFLNRNHAGAPTFAPFSKDEALRRWSETLCYGDDETRSDQRRTLQKLHAVDISEFRYSDIHSAVEFLSSALGS
jgi:hypothetical protein